MVTFGNHLCQGCQVKKIAKVWWQCTKKHVWLTNSTIQHFKRTQLDEPNDIPAHSLCETKRRSLVGQTITSGNFWMESLHLQRNDQLGRYPNPRQKLPRAQQENHEVKSSKTQFATTYWDQLSSLCNSNTIFLTCCAIAYLLRYKSLYSILLVTEIHTKAR